MQEGPTAYSPASDWWAAGVLGYELLYGRPPWPVAGGPAAVTSLEALLHRVGSTSPAFPGPEEGGPQVCGSGLVLRVHGQGLSSRNA